MEYYTFYPENLTEFDFSNMIKDGTCFITEDAVHDLYNRSLPESLRTRHSSSPDGAYEIRVDEKDISKNIHLSHLEKRAFSLYWRASSATQQNIFAEKIQVVKDVDRDILIDAEAIRDLVADNIKKDGYSETLDWEMEDIEDDMRFNSGYMVRYFLGAYMPSEEELSDWYNLKAIAENDGIHFSIPPTEAQGIMRHACENFAAKGGNIDFVKLKITNLMNGYLREKNLFEKALELWNDDRDEAQEFISQMCIAYDIKYRHEDFVACKRELEKTAIQFQLLLTSLEELPSPYDKTIDNLLKNPEQSIREAISQYDIPMLKNVLFCKHQLFLEKRRTLAIEQGIEYDLIPNSPEIILMTKVLEEIKAMEKENKTESE